MDNGEEIWFLLNFSWDLDGCSLKKLLKDFILNTVLADLLLLYEHFSQPARRSVAMDDKKLFHFKK